MCVFFCINNYVMEAMPTHGAIFNMKQCIPSVVDILIVTDSSTGRGSGEVLCEVSD